MTKRIQLSNRCRPPNELFGRVAGSPFNAHLGISSHGFLVYADGYRLAADTVVRNLRRSEKQFLVFPVCYLYRHYLELMIKGLTGLANAILDGTLIYSEGHDLAALWKRCRPSLERVMPNYSKAGFNEVGKCVKAFASFDFKGEFFRYPEGRNRRLWRHPVRQPGST